MNDNVVRYITEVDLEVDQALHEIYPLLLKGKYVRPRRSERAYSRWQMALFAMKYLAENKDMIIEYINFLNTNHIQEEVGALVEVLNKDLGVNDGNGSKTEPIGPQVGSERRGGNSTTQVQSDNSVAVSNEDSDGGESDAEETTEGRTEEDAEGDDEDASDE